MDGQDTVRVTTNKTVAATDCGTIQIAAADGVVFTLPAAGANLVGLQFEFKNGGVAKTNAPVGTGDNASVGFTVQPNSVDGVEGLGFTSTVNHGVVNTKATAKVGDSVRVICSGVTGVHAWHLMTPSVGVFAQN